jgi:hypothetical protein
LQPGFGRYVLRGFRRDDTQVTQQCRVAVPPEPRERRLAAPLRRSKHAFELLADHSAGATGIKAPSKVATVC